MSTRNLRSKFTHYAPKSVVREDDLRKNLVVADGVHLLLCAVHVTGDLSLLDRYADKVGKPEMNVTLDIFRRVSEASKAGATSFDPKLLLSDDDQPESPEARAELVDLLCSVLTLEDQAEYLRLDALPLFARMAEVASGRRDDETYLKMCQEQSGFVPDQRAIEPTKTPPETLNLAIIGAGMTGLDAAVKATDRGFKFEVFDSEEGVGGLWWSQRYPGVAVDTPSVYYSLSYEVTPDWSKFFPLGDEYRAYLTGLAEKYQLTNHLHFRSEITKMEWIDDDQVWELTVLDKMTHKIRKVRAAAVITAAGHLNRPKYPDVNGREDFDGESIHTARWRNVDLDGKRVAVVGVGASGIQVIASIADKVEHLTVFQRQAHWVGKYQIGDGDVGEEERWLRRHLPYYLQWSRFLTFALLGSVTYEMNRVDKEWIKTHPVSISLVNDFLMQMGIEYINETFGEDSEMAKKLTPDFAYGGKRPVRDPGDFGPGGYYYALSLPHVELVTEGLARVVPEGIVTSDGSLFELDVIIWATGMTLDWLSPIEIVGRDGIRLNGVWADNNPRTYIGGTVPGFPNLFVNDGPNTGVATGGGGHNFMTETVNHFAFECLQLIVERGATSIEVTQEAHDAHNVEIEALMLDLIWNYERGADTYYRNQAGRIILPNPWTAVEYWDMSQCPDESKFVLYSKDRVGATAD